MQCCEQITQFRYINFY
jgi:hypothetical protein